LAGGFAGSADAAAVSRSMLHGVGAPLLVQSAAWSIAAVALPSVLGASRRGLFMSGWLAALLAGQALLPALAGAAPEPPGRSAVAIWAVAILVALGVQAPEGDTPAAKPVPAEE
jgi:sugar phosphate permease